MARQAPVVVNTCTWCFVSKGENVLATTPIPITLTTLGEDGGFTLTYDPTDTEADCMAWGCDMHAEMVKEQLAQVQTDIHENIIDVVNEEEAPEEDNTPEDYEPLSDPEDHGDESGEKEGTGEPTQDSVPVNAAPVGEKVTPSTPAQPNPAPDTPKGEVDMSNPKEDERKAIRLFWKKGGYEKKGINAPGMRGIVSQKLLRDWRSSDEYRNWMSTGVQTP